MMNEFNKKYNYFLNHLLRDLKEEIERKLFRPFTPSEYEKFSQKSKRQPKSYLNYYGWRKERLKELKQSA